VECAHPTIRVYVILLQIVTITVFVLKITVNVYVYVMMGIPESIVNSKIYRGIVKTAWDLTHSGPRERIKMVCAYVRPEIGLTV
jgi:hypothetical protein